MFADVRELALVEVIIANRRSAQGSARTNEGATVMTGRRKDIPLHVGGEPLDAGIGGGGV